MDRRRSESGRTCVFIIFLLCFWKIPRLFSGRNFKGHHCCPRAIAESKNGFTCIIILVRDLHRQSIAIIIKIDISRMWGLSQATKVGFLRLMEEEGMDLHGVGLCAGDWQEGVETERVGALESLALG